VDPDDAADPIGETARSVLDGHIVLSRDLAARNHYPAIDLLQSASRVMRDVISPAHQAAARTIVDLTATYRQSEDLIAIGAYKPGADPRLDKAVAAHDRIEAFLRQDIDEQVEFAASVRSLIDLAEAVG
jgi:flagellum-specific ATP synthase